MANRNNFQSMMKRARWDRLGGALVVLIILILLIVLIAKGCHKEKEPAQEVQTTPIIDAAETTEPPTQAIVDNSRAIYLSPSTQEDNLYACDATVNEEQVMFQLAQSVKALLEADGYTVYMCQDNDNVKTKVTKGNELKCGAYVALHSNSNSNEVGAQGTECYFNSTISGSRELAENIYNRVAELTPSEDRGLKDESQRELYEVLNNHYPCAQLEVEYHDSAEGSQWILDNQDAVAKAVKDGIVAFLTNKEAGSAPEETDASLTDSVADSTDAGEAE